jgi:hypothetical protein
MLGVEARTVHVDDGPVPALSGVDSTRSMDRAMREARRAGAGRSGVEVSLS